jgi:hypothetical protein
MDMPFQCYNAPYFLARFEKSHLLLQFFNSSLRLDFIQTFYRFLRKLVSKVRELKNIKGFQHRFHLELNKLFIYIQYSVLQFHQGSQDMGLRQRMFRYLTLCRSLLEHSA